MEEMRLGQQSDSRLCPCGTPLHCLYLDLTLSVCLSLCLCLSQGSDIHHQSRSSRSGSTSGLFNKPNETTEKILNESKNIAQKIGHGFKTVKEKAVAAAAKLKEPTPNV
jgi:hypothetical protein